MSAGRCHQAGGLWARGVLHGKVGGAFTSTATRHGGQQTTLFSIITNLLHFGMVIVGLDYGHAGQMTLDEITCGSPYGATTIEAVTAHAGPPQTNSREPATRAARLPRPRKDCMAEQAGRSGFKRSRSHRPTARLAAAGRVTFWRRAWCTRKRV